MSDIGDKRGATMVQKGGGFTGVEGVIYRTNDGRHGMAGQSMTRRKWSFKRLVSGMTCTTMYTYTIQKRN